MENQSNFKSLGWSLVLYSLAIFLCISCGKETPVNEETDQSYVRGAIGDTGSSARVGGKIPDNAVNNAYDYGASKGKKVGPNPNSSGKGP